VAWGADVLALFSGVCGGKVAGAGDAGDAAADVVAAERSSGGVDPWAFGYRGIRPQTRANATNGLSGTWGVDIIRGSNFPARSARRVDCGSHFGASLLCKFFS